MILKNIYNVVIIQIDPPCKWTGWQDVDNPSGEGDFETPPDGCNIEHYEFQLVDGGTIYNNVSDVFWYLLHDDPYVYCRNVDQPLKDCHIKSYIVYHTSLSSKSLSQKCHKCTFFIFSIDSHRSGSIKLPKF